jgi:hypothetical protein
MEVSSIKVIHEGPVATDKYEHMFQKPNKTAVLVEGDRGSSENAVQKVNSSSNLFRGHSDDTHREVEIEPKPADTRAHLSLSSNSRSKTPIRSNFVPNAHDTKKSIISNHGKDGVICVDVD